MNKIFKVVWSKSKECYVVVSEFAKNNSGKKKIVVAGIFAALAMTNANVALAVNDVPTGADATAVAFGSGATVTGANAVGLGSGVSVTGANAVGLGISASVTGANAVGLGSNASVTGVNAIGLGTNVKATLSDVVAIGTAAKVESASGGVAIGQNAYSKARYSNTPSVAVGKNSIANGGTAVALGTGATVNEAGNSYSQGIAIGGGALPGQGAVVVGDQAIAIGGNTKALGHSSIVIGGDDADRMTSTRAVYTDITTGKPAVASVSAAVKALTGYEIKYRDYNNATADHIGITVGTKGQSGNAGIAIGTGADSKNRIAGSLTGVNTSAADNDSVTNAIAIGTGAKANRDNSVALGGGSTTDKPGTKQTSYTLPTGVTAKWSGGESTLEGDVVSFGAEGFERQLKNVAPGEVSATSTDAINGSQLAAIADQIAHKYVSITSDVVPNKDNTGAKADESIAIGPNASTDKAATSSVAIGDGARAIVTNGVAIGSNSSADIVAGVKGYNPEAGRTDAMGALNGTTLTSTYGGVAVGSLNKTRQINYVAAGTADTDAVNVAQLKSVNLAFTGDTGSGDVNLANSKLAVNGDNTYITTTANGKKITIAGKKQDITVTNGVATATPGMADAKNVADAINQAVANSSSSWNLSANGEATTATVEKGNTVDFSGDDNVTVARNDKNISVSLKKDLTGLNSASFNNAAGNPTVKIDGDKGINAGDMKVTNVADGVDDKDAVNVSQLKKTDDKAEANKAAIARKISLDGNTGSTTEKSLSTGDVKFKIKGEDGITTAAAGDDVTVKLDTDTKNKIDNAANKDLSNLTPAGEQEVKDLAAWNVVANSETAEKVKGGDTVKFIDGDNVEITQAGKDFTISTKKDVTFDNVTANQAITAPKVKATTGVETPQVTGLTNTDWVPGQTQPVSGRAATEDQLKKVDDQVAANKDNITKNAGDIKTNKDNIDKNTTAIARKISLGGNTGSTDEKSLSTGDVKFNVKGENGLTTVANGDDVTVKLDDATKDKIDNAANQDLSNLTPAGEQQVKDLAAWNVVANGETAEKVQGGDTVKFINGDNIEITQAGKNFTIATKKDVTFDTVTANDTITAPKVKATTGVETPEVTGLTNTTWVPGQTQPVSGRAATEDQLKAVDDQVADNKDKIGKNADNIADNKKAIDKNAADIATNKDNIAANKDNITKNAGDIATNKADIAKNKDNIDKNTTAIARKISLGGDTGSTDEKSLSTGDVKFNVKGENGLTTVANGDDVTVKLDDATKDKIDNAANKDLSNLTPAGEQQVKDLAAWNVVANDGTAEKVQGGDTVKFINGDNIEITQNGKDFTVATKKDVTFDTVTANDTITAPKVKATTGVETPEVTGLTNKTWVPGQTQPVSGRAATEDQLKAVDDQVAANKDNITKNAGDIKTNKDNIDKNTTAIARKISLGGDTGSTDEKSLSTGDVKFNIKGQNGIVTEANGEDVTVKLDDDTANKINNAANTDLSNLTDAGKQQVKDLAAWNVVANGNTAEKVEGGNTVKFIDGDNISITQNGKDFTIATKKDVTFDTVTANDTITAPKVKATDGVETPEVTGLTNKTWVPGQTQPVSGRAATEDQLKAVDDQVAANKDNITKNAGDIATNKANIAANKAQIDKNTEAIGRKISLGGNTGSTDEKSLSTGDVKFNIKGENGLTTVANGEDVTVKIDDETKAKIDNAANQDLSNLTDAGKQQVKDLSAWNVTAAGGTVEKVQGGDTVKFQAGDNLEVKQDKTTFTYSLAKDLKGLNSVTVGDENGASTKITPAGTTVKDAAGNSTTVNGAGMTITPANAAANPVSLTVNGLNNGGNQIHGVAPGTADTDAVNVSQLKEAKAGLQQAINDVGAETQRVGAHAAAMAALKPIQYDPLEPTQIMAGIGNYRGETAGAIGLAHYRTEDTMFNVGITLGSSHSMVNAGVTHKFGGSRDRKDAVPERYKAGPISSIYVMQDEVSHLRNQNEEYKSKLEQQQSEIDALKAAVNQLLANKA
ncbi:MAG: ESPR-type extended signal peptide-containing protein [Veillonella sp.]|uniref:ESPR-type extended signal peptide-containing protein n=1 Tax=Veillonella sp. TaxID=1926307 RepID=UPI0029124A11|nr:ESPR-type extended signal peptide-containing protein [Veillonella sp.]MDU4712582.1 ESPR-type extended signal peptide-containing protein [Veillonella sp.]